MPRVSVIIPTHNRPELLNEALASVQAQTFNDWEAIIVDDASTPPTNIAARDKRICLLRHSSSKGGASAKNTGIKAASAEILAFLDDDDLYANTYLERALGIFDRNPSLEVIFVGVSWFGASGSVSQREYYEAMEQTVGLSQGKTLEEGVLAFSECLVDSLLKSVPMAFQRPVVRKRAMERIGVYRPDCLLWDCDWAIRAALNANAALLQSGLYLQRAEGQGYVSQGNRRLEHITANIEIKDRFFQETRYGQRPTHLAAIFRKAAAKAWFDCAWHHYKNDDHLKAFCALWNSELRHFSISHLKLVAQLMLPKKIF
jgi:glycosyltransferase involved in cell wall biosynthesis